MMWKPKIRTPHTFRRLPFADMTARREQQSDAPLSLWCALLLLGCYGLANANDELDFDRDVAPILVQHCLDCHQPNKRSGELSLITLDEMKRGGELGPAIVPGDIKASLMLSRIKGGEMPPAEARDRL